ncbi:3'-5' exonuclease [Polaribacter sp. Z022]|uniref:3'-5' exonuclease n=1 Tax=Polaribacter sp. Z022 TaxID=2927125 RepID=UPI00202188A3|nr:3'-5' exonuclease [Polaribacter sp. Z022]MCL7754361.1 3'-5' exonuclease [Polaribacter sp. Z022]
MKWFKRKTYPPFWDSYLNYFKEEQNTNLEEIRFVIFDTETTGLDTKNDRILSIGTIAVINNTIKVNDNLENYLNQDFFNTETVKIHGLLSDKKENKIEEKEAIIQFLEHIKNAILVAHHAAFDITMINNALIRLNLPKLKNKVLDTGQLYKKTKKVTTQNHFSLDQLAEKFNIPLHDRHTASGDAYITAILFVKLIVILKKENPNLSLNQLLQNKERRGLL